MNERRWEQDDKGPQRAKPEAVESKIIYANLESIRNIIAVVGLHEH